MVSHRLICAAKLTKYLRFALLALVLFFTAQTSFAQAPNVGDDTITPNPGAGHDYIHLLSETVSPSNGSVNISINFPTLKSRGISLPLSLQYNSSAVNFFDLTTDFHQGHFDVSPNYGWSTSIPTLTFSSATYTWPDMHPPSTFTCTYTNGYNFNDPSGGSHPLYLSSFSLENIGLGESCDSTSILSFYHLTLEKSWLGGDGVYAAEATNACGVLSAGCNQGQPPIAVHDVEGTLYSFGDGTLGQRVGFGNAGGMMAYPMFVEDRNGNKITFGFSGSGASLGMAATDSIGRSLYTVTPYLLPTTITAGGFSYPIGRTTGGGTGHTFASLQVSPPASTWTCSVNLAANGAKSVTTVTLPTMQGYTFKYDAAYGLISEIDYPNGGWVKYTWKQSDDYSELATYDAPTANGTGSPYPAGCHFQFKTPVVATRTVGYSTGSSPALTQSFIYHTFWNSDNLSWDHKTTTVSTADNVTGLTSQTIYHYKATALPHVPSTSYLIANQIAIEDYTEYFDWGNLATPIRTVYKTWAGPNFITCEFTKLETGALSGTLYGYGAFTGADLAVVTDKKEYDYGVLSTPCPATPPAPTRETITTLHPFSQHPLYPYYSYGTIQVGIIDNKPSSVQVYGNGNLIAETDYDYDQTAVGNISAAKHDDTYFSPTNNARGNLTTQTKKCFIGSTACTNSVTTFTYDQTGQLLTRTDPCGNTPCSDVTGSMHTTQYFYADTYSPCAGVAPPFDTTNAYLTTVTDPLSHSQNYCYGYDDGHIRSSTDPNSQTTSYFYDSIHRLNKTTLPGGGLSTIGYVDSIPTVSTSVKQYATPTFITTLTTMDGLGHVVKSQLTSDVDAAGVAAVATTDTVYNGLGLVSSRSNPYRTTSDPTVGTTAYQYDALGRTKIVTAQDGSQITTTYPGNCTIVTDQALHARESCSDGLGRLAQVIEDPSGTPYETDYSYNALDDLLCVGQKGTSSGIFDPTCAAIPTAWRPRTFTYDSLSRLICANNPESSPTTSTGCPTPAVASYTPGTTGYSYDADGNLSTKTSPKPNQPSNSTLTVVATYSYDVGSRLKQKSFNDGPPATATVQYGYDNVALTGCTTAPPTLTIANYIGRRTSMCDGAGAESWSYDVMGRILTDTRINVGSTNLTKSTTYTYNLDGSTNSVTYPFGRTITYAYNSAGRPTSASGSPGTLTFVKTATYAPQGGLATLQNNNSFPYITNYLYNTRFQPCRIAVRHSSGAPGSCTDSTNIGDLLDYSYTYPALNNGNISAITNNRDTTRSQNFTYDSLNRLATAKTTSTTGTKCWDEVFGYDAWGNLLTIGRISGYTCSNEEMLSTSATIKNQIMGDTYDPAGNLITAASTSYTYDAENRLHTAGGATYFYDGDGKRVQKSNGTIYWYGTSSDPLEESDLAGNYIAQFIFFNGKRVAQVNSGNGLDFYFADNLGTSRAMALSPNSALCYDADFYPFGGERQYTSTCSQNFKFTGKERDSESGLDNFGARYESSTIGRFISPDWSAKPIGVPYADTGDPQSMNLYSYVKNNPLNASDPDGHCVVDVEQHNWLWCMAHSLRLAETKKEIAAREEWERAVAAYNKKMRDKYGLDNNTLMFLAFQGSVIAAAVADGAGSDGENNTTAEETTTIAAGAEGSAASEAELTGITAANGTKITGFTNHGINRAIGEGASGVAGVRAGTRPQAILDALRNPTSIQSGVDSQGRPYQMFTGQNARVIVNPQSGKIVSVNPTSAAGAH